MNVVVKRRNKFSGKPKGCKVTKTTKKNCSLKTNSLKKLLGAANNFISLAFYFFVFSNSEFSLFK